jgi:hypothetical protein
MSNGVVTQACEVPAVGSAGDPSGVYWRPDGTRIQVGCFLCTPFLFRVLGSSLCDWLDSAWFPKAREVITALRLLHEMCNPHQRNKGSHTMRQSSPTLSPYVFGVKWCPERRVLPVELIG